MRNSTRRLLAEKLAERLPLSASGWEIQEGDEERGGEEHEYRWHNQGMPEDVDGDSVISARDALLVVDDLNAHGARQIELEESLRAQVDVNRDDASTPIDVLLIVNRLNLEAENRSEPYVDLQADDSDSLSDELDSTATQADELSHRGTSSGESQDESLDSELEGRTDSIEASMQAEMSEQQENAETHLEDRRESNTSTEATSADDLKSLSSDEFDHQRDDRPGDEGEPNSGAETADLHEPILAGGDAFVSDAIDSALGELLSEFDMEDLRDPSDIAEIEGDRIDDKVADSSEEQRPDISDTREPLELASQHQEDGEDSSQMIRFIGQPTAGHEANHDWAELEREPSGDDSLQAEANENHDEVQGSEPRLEQEDESGSHPEGTRVEAQDDNGQGDSVENGQHMEESSVATETAQQESSGGEHRNEHLEYLRLNDMHSGDVEFEGRLIGSGRGKVEFEMEHGSAKFEVEIRTTPNQTLPVVVDGIEVGVITTNSRGQGKLKFKQTGTGQGSRAFPDSFPAITTGTRVTVGEALSGLLSSDGEHDD